MSYSITRKEIIEAAATFRGVKFRHQGRDAETGVDCVGLLVCLGQKIGYPEIFDIEGYRRTPSADVIRETLRKNCDEISVKDAKKGDIFLMRLGGRKPRHASIYFNDAINLEKGIVPSIIHASIGGVKVQPLSDFPKEWFVCGFRLRGVVD